MTTAARVLVVDELTDTTEVLRAVLEPRGMTVDQARHGEFTGTPEKHLTETPVPGLSLVVVDDDTATLRGLSASAWKNVPTVIIGRTKAGPAATGAAGRRYLGKPFQYAELLRAIDALIGEKAA